MASIDVLVLTALKDELDALRKLAPEGFSGWRDESDKSGFPFHQRAFQSTDGTVFQLAAAWIGEMGEMAAAVRTLELVDFLSPRFLGLCGICAGKRGEVSLGDIIVADRVYSYDHGKIITSENAQGQFIQTLYHDIQTYNLYRHWKYKAEYFSDAGGWLHELEKLRPKSREWQTEQLLRALLNAEEGSQEHPIRDLQRSVTYPSWPNLLKELEEKHVISFDGDTFVLAASGKQLAQRSRILYPDGVPGDAEIRVRVGAIASGKVVQKDAQLFKRLERLVRTTLGVEMEATAIGYVAERLEIRSIVAKAVSDYADESKDDSFRAFAAHASAAFLLEFFQRTLTAAEINRTARLNSNQSLQNLDLEIVISLKQVVTIRDKSLSVVQEKDDHPIMLASHSREYQHQLVADPGFVFVNCHFEQHVSDHASAISCRISGDGAQILLSFSLESGPQFDRWRGFLSGRLSGTQQKVCSATAIGKIIYVARHVHADYLVVRLEEDELARVENISIFREKDHLYARGSLKQNLVTVDNLYSMRLDCIDNDLVLQVRVR